MPITLYLNISMNKFSKALQVTLLLIFCLSTFTASSQTNVEEIKSIMNRQVNAWNESNLEAFMKGYWESDQLMFIGSKGLTYGWSKTLENYKKGYPDKEAMGKLSFAYKEFVPLGEMFMLVIGQWRIERSDSEELQGHFSLTWEKKEGEWVIIADHSS